MTVKPPLASPPPATFGKLGKKGYCVAMFVRELDEWKVRLAYWK